MNKKKYSASTLYDPRLKIYPSKIQGKGMFATRPIKDGESVCIVGGQLMTDEEFHKFIPTAAKYNAIQVDEDLHLVDVSIPIELMEGSINHSCDSNTWMADEVTIIANRNIAQGEEVTVDYALFSVTGGVILDQCQCGSSLCRGRMTGDDWKLERVQEQYRNHFSPFINKRIENTK